MIIMLHVNIRSKEQKYIWSWLVEISANFNSQSPPKCYQKQPRQGTMTMGDHAASKKKPDPKYIILGSCHPRTMWLEYYALALIKLTLWLNSLFLIFHFINFRNILLTAYILHVVTFHNQNSSFEQSFFDHIPHRWSYSDNSYLI